MRGEQAAGRQGELGSASTSQIVTLQVRGVVAPGVPLIEADNPNPPDVANAPKGPYIKDRMSSTYRWIIGLGNDERATCRSSRAPARTRPTCASW